MRTAQELTRLLLLCAAGALLAATMAGAQTGVPEVPTGTAPTSVTPSLEQPSASGLPGGFTLWSGLLLRPLIQPAWPLVSVVPPTSWFHSAVLREPRRWGLPVSRAAVDRFIRR